MLKWQILCHVNLAMVKKNGKQITLATEWRIDCGVSWGWGEWEEAEDQQWG